MSTITKYINVKVQVLYYTNNIKGQRLIHAKIWKLIKMNVEKELHESGVIVTDIHMVLYIKLIP